MPEYAGRAEKGNITRIASIPLFWLVLRTPRPATEPRNGPTRNFHEKYRKNTPRPEILASQNLPPKYPENTEKNTPKIPKMRIFGVFFFRLFWGYLLAVPESRPGGYLFFGVFSWKFRVGPSWSSVAGRGVLKVSLWLRVWF